MRIGSAIALLLLCSLSLPADGPQGKGDAVTRALNDLRTELLVAYDVGLAAEGPPKQVAEVEQAIAAEWRAETERLLDEAFPPPRREELVAEAEREYPCYRIGDRIAVRLAPGRLYTGTLTRVSEQYLEVDGRRFLRSENKSLILTPERATQLRQAYVSERFDLPRQAAAQRRRQEFEEELPKRLRAAGYRLLQGQWLPASEIQVQLEQHVQALEQELRRITAAGAGPPTRLSWKGLEVTGTEMGQLDTLLGPRVVLRRENGWLELIPLADLSYLDREERVRDRPVIGCDQVLVLRNGREVSAYVIEERQDSYLIRLPDGRTGKVAAGNVVSVVIRLDEELRPKRADRHLALQSAVSAELGGGLQLAPVKQILRKEFGEVREMGNWLFVPKAGPRGEFAWLHVDGRLVVASTGSLRSPKTFAFLTLAWKRVATVVASVTASLQGPSGHQLSTYSSYHSAMKPWACGWDPLDQRYHHSAEFYTLRAKQFQYLACVHVRRFGPWSLAWPSAKPTWADLRGLSGRTSFCRLTFRGKRLRKLECDLRNTPFGQHRLEGYLDGGAVVIHAYFDKPNGEIALYDSTHKDVTWHSSQSKPLAELGVPVP